MDYLIILYVVLAEFLYKVHKLNRLEYGKLRLEFSPSQNTKGKVKRKQGRLRAGSSTKLLQK